MYKFIAVLFLCISAQSGAMNKAELIDAIASDAGLSKNKTKVILDTLINVAKDELNNAGPEAGIEFLPFGHITNTEPKEQLYDGHVTVLKAADGTYELVITREAPPWKSDDENGLEDPEVSVTLVSADVISQATCLSAADADADSLRYRDGWNGTYKGKTRRTQPISCNRGKKEHEYIGHVTLLRGTDTDAGGAKEFIGHVTLLKGSESDFYGHVTVLRQRITRNMISALILRYGVS